MNTLERLARRGLDVAAKISPALFQGEGSVRARIRLAVRRRRLEKRLRRGPAGTNLAETVALDDLVAASGAEAVVGFLAEGSGPATDAIKEELARRGVLSIDLVYFLPHCNTRKLGERRWATSLCDAFCAVSRKRQIPLVIARPTQTAVLMARQCGPVVYLVPPAERLRGRAVNRRHQQLLEVADLLVVDADEGRQDADGKATVRLDEAGEALPARYPLARPQEPETRIAAGEQPPPVDLLTFFFFDWQGDSLRLGGAERYLLDLSRLLKSKGFRPRIVQNAVRPFEKSVDGIEVVGMPAVRRLDEAGLFGHYLAHSSDAARLVCSPVTLARRRTSRRIIGINHMVGWDYGDWNRRRFATVTSAVDAVQAVVCVDTNFINWMRTIDWPLSEKLVYVPNYFDPAVFRPREKSFDDDKVVISFPRSLYEAKGVFHTFELIRRIAPRFENTSFLFAGQTEYEDVARELDELAAEFPGRVRRVELSFDEVAEVYHESQIVLVPTVHSEGTSLTCIEALAANNAVVATNVGGLANLILNGYNGLLIPPGESDLERAVVGLLTDRRRRAELARNGIASVQPFQKSRWQRQWSRLIDVW